MKDGALFKFLCLLGVFGFQGHGKGRDTHIRTPLAEAGRVSSLGRGRQLRQRTGHAVEKSSWHIGEGRRLDRRRLGDAQRLDLCVGEGPFWLALALLLRRLEQNQSRSPDRQTALNSKVVDNPPVRRKP